MNIDTKNFMEKHRTSYYNIELEDLDKVRYLCKSTSKLAKGVLDNQKLELSKTNKKVYLKDYNDNILKKYSIKDTIFFIEREVN